MVWYTTRVRPIIETIAARISGPFQAPSRFRLGNRMTNSRLELGKLLSSKLQTNIGETPSG